MKDSISRLAGHFATQRSDLPDAVRDLVDARYFFGDWDSLTPTQRIDLAWQYDTPQTDAARLQHVYSLMTCANDAKPSNTTEMSELKKLNDRIKATRRQLLTDQVNRAHLIPTPTEVERFYQHDMLQNLTNLLDALDIKEFDPEAALPSFTPRPAVAEADRRLLATRQQLIDAFGSFTGMNIDWFSNIKDSPALLAARKVKGQGGKGHPTEPLFCPFEVLQWLINPARRKGRPMGRDKGWELFEGHFSRSYAAFSVGDPRAD